MKKWWKMILNAAMKTAEIMIYEQIGEDFWGDGVSAKEFAKDLKALGNVTQINVRINSPGGSVFDGLAIYNLLKAHKANVTTYNDGLAASIASVIFQSGNKRIAAANSITMIHDPFGFVQGTAADMQKMAEALEKIKDSLIGAYVNPQLSEDLAKKLMSDETWMTADEALSYGLVDEIQDAMKIAAHFDLSTFKNIPENIKNQMKNEKSTQISVEDLVTDLKDALKNFKEEKSGSDINKNLNEEETKMKCSVCGNTHDGLVDGICPGCILAKANQQSVLEKAVMNETVRVQAITKMGDTYKCSEDAAKFIEDKKSIDAFRTFVMDKIEKDGIPVNTSIVVGDDMAAKRPFKNIGEQLQSIHSAAARPSAVDVRLQEINNAATGLGEEVGSDGAFLLQNDFTLAMLERAAQESDVEPRCTTIPIGPGANGISAPYIDETSRATGSRWGGVQVYRRDEGSTPTGKKPKFGLLELKLEKLTGLCYATDELLQDSSALGAIITKAFGEEFAFVVQDEIINGSGAGQMKGILKSGGPIVSVAKETGQIAGSIVTENLDKMYARMYARGLRNAVWLINQDCWPELFNLYRGVGTAGIPVFTPPTGIEGAPYGMIHGRPILPIEQCQTLGTTGDIIFADFSQYLIIEKDGLETAQSMHVKFVEAEQAFRFIKRNNGQPIWKTAVTPKNGNKTQSPFIKLDTRA